MLRPIMSLTEVKELNHLYFWVFFPVFCSVSRDNIVWFITQSTNQIQIMSLCCTDISNLWSHHTQTCTVIVILSAFVFVCVYFVCVYWVVYSRSQQAQSTWRLFQFIQFLFAVSMGFLQVCLSVEDFNANFKSNNIIIKKWTRINAITMS